jgi:hypothetical protein
MYYLQLLCLTFTETLYVTYVTIRYILVNAFIFPQIVLYV